MAALGQSYTGAAAYVYDGGYGTAAWTAGVASSSVIPTAVGQVNVTGGVASNAQVLLMQPRASDFSAGSIRNAVGPDVYSLSLATSNATLYAGGSVTGWRNYTNSIQIDNSNVTNTRTVQETYSSSGTVQLFGSSDTGSGGTAAVGISVISEATSSSSVLVQTATSSSLASPYAFVLLTDPNNPNLSNGYNTAYIADDGTASSEAAGNAGIEKWTFNGTAWNKDYTLLGMLPTGSNATGYRGLAGQMDAAGSGDAILYAVDASGTYLQQVIDPISSLDEHRRHVHHAGHRSGKRCVPWRGLGPRRPGSRTEHLRSVGGRRGPVVVYPPPPSSKLIRSAHSKVALQIWPGHQQRWSGLFVRGGRVR